MTKTAIDLPTSRIRTVCKILEVFEEPLDFPEQLGTAVVVLTPLGTELVIPVACETYREPMQAAEGKFVSVDLSASWSVMKRTEERQYRFTDIAGKELSGESDPSFRVIGQYAGDTGVDVLLQCQFLVRIGHDGNVEPRIGDWLQAHGELSVHWSAKDIIE